MTFVLYFWHLESVANNQVFQVVSVALYALFNFFNVVAIFWYPKLTVWCGIIEMGGLPSIAKNRKCDGRRFYAPRLFQRIGCNRLLLLELNNWRDAKKDKKGNKKTNLKGSFDVSGNLQAPHHVVYNCSQLLCYPQNQMSWTCQVWYLSNLFKMIHQHIF